jgi:hypothetical protein
LQAHFLIGSADARSCYWAWSSRRPVSLFADLAGSGASYWQNIVPLVMPGVGVSMVLPVAPAAVMSAVAPPDIGRASAVNNTLQRLGTAFGIAAATVVFLANGNLSTSLAFIAGMRPALYTAAGLSILGALSALAVRRSHEQGRDLADAVLAGAATSS